MNSASQRVSRTAAPFVRRRQQVMASLGPVPLLVQAGTTLARNYPANPYPFRASSHFLYLTGLALPDAVLLLHQGQSLLFIEPAASDDELWHGPRPSQHEWQTQSGVDMIYPLSELPTYVKKLPRYATLPLRKPAHAEDEIGLEAIVQARRIHDEAAVHEMRRAVAVTHQAHVAGMQATRPGVTEAVVRAAMEQAIQAADFTTAYQSIVTVHGEVLHNHHYTHTCQAGDLLLADVGAESDTGWASDITRTWPVSGVFSPTQRDAYELVLQAQQTAIAMVRPGVRYREVHLAACRVLAQGLCDLGLLQGHADDLVERGAHALFFPHGVGHLLGLDVHDMEDLGETRVAYAPGRSRSTQFGLSYLRLDLDVQPGMAFTIEPGLYFVPAILQNPTLTEPFRKDVHWDRLAHFADVRGIRIEDNILVTPQGHEVLSAAIPKQTKDVEQIVQKLQ